jgi:PIN domain nuclease of toxin-antitoxin system
VIVLDTHIWVWWASQARALPQAAAEAIDQSIRERELHVSSISAWEVSLLVSRGRLQLTMDVQDWVARSEALPFLNFVPVDNRIALRSAHLPTPLHDDPADRMIVATALTLGATLITRDERLLSYPHVRTIWDT